MADQGSAESSYTMGYSEEFLQLLHRRNADRNTAYLLPHLRPGLRVLDFGCGPGTISVGLARAVEPGELHGIDIEESQIDLGSVRRRGRRAWQHDLPRRGRDRSSLRGRLFRRRPLPCGSHARSRHRGGAVRGQARPEARRYRRQPGNVRRILVPGAQQRGRGLSVGHVLEPSRCQRRPSPDGEGAQEQVPRGRLLRGSDGRILRLLRSGRKMLPSCMPSYSTGSIHPGS